MQQANTLDFAGVSAHDALPATEIAKAGHDEAAALATAELGRFLDVLETLDEGDWQQPTDCTLWTVHGVVAHQAGSLEAFSSFANFRRHRSKEVIQSYLDRGMSELDASNQAQVDLRAGRTPAEMIAEIRQRGPEAIAFRKGLPALVRAIRLPDPDSGKWMSVGYLTDIILVRDMWSHRLDVCRATGREFVQTPAHDGRILEIVVRDLAQQLRAVLGLRSVVYELRGTSGGCWRMGSNSRASARLTMDALDFSLLASERTTADAIRSQGLVAIEGDEELANLVLDQTIVLY